MCTQPVSVQLATEKIQTLQQCTQGHNIHYVVLCHVQLSRSLLNLLSDRSSHLSSVAQHGSRAHCMCLWAIRFHLRLQ